LKRRVIPPVLAGEKIAALAVTEPSGGSDVAHLKTTAIRDGDHYIVNGEKTFITSGLRADFITTAARTDPKVLGAGGISAARDRGRHAGAHAHPAQEDGLVELRHRAPALRRLPGCRRPTWWARRTAASSSSCATSTTSACSWRRWPAAMPRCASKKPWTWARQRTIGGTALSERQVVRHKLMDMTLRIEAARTLVYDLAYRIEHRLADPAQLVARICLAKVQATQAMQFCADQAVQLLGGMGYMRGTKSERIYREVKVMMIGGGSEEVMKDLAARQLGL
jgi:acyl-CoA dehydrogenase